MAYAAHARVWETPVTVTGTGSVTLPGTASSGGYQTFAAAYSSGDTCPYVIRDTVTGAWEAGTGTVTIATGVATLARTTVLESTNANALVGFAGNACDVQVDYPPSDLNLTNVGLGAAVNNGALSAPAGLGYLGPIKIVPSRFYATATTGGAGNTAGAPTYQPFFVPNEATLQSLSMVVTGTSVATMEAFLGLYNDDGSGEPGTLVAASGTITVTAAGTFTETVTPEVLTPGLYWARYAGNNYVLAYQNKAVATYGFSPVSFYLGAKTPGGATGSGGTFYTDTNGAVPAPSAPSGLNIQDGNSYTVLVILGF